MRSSVVIFLIGAILPLCQADSGACVIRTVAGAGQRKSGDPQPAILGQVGGSFVLAPDGTIYIASATQVFKVSAGLLYTIGGTQQTNDSTGDEGPVAAAHFTSLSSIALGPDGSLYVYDRNRIRRISPDGIVHAFAGTGQPGFSGDARQAADARVQSTGALTFDNNGNLLIADTFNYRIRKVTPDGIISTIAGIGGGFAPPGDNGLATLAQLNGPSYVAIDRSGQIYFVDSARIRVIGTDGVIRAFAGGGNPTRTGFEPIVAGTFTNITAVGIDIDGSVIFSEGSTGYGAELWRATPGGDKISLGKIAGAGTIAVDSAGAIYYTYFATIRKRASDGTEQIILGADSGTTVADGIPAMFVPLGPSGIAIGPQGSLYISDVPSRRVRIVRSDGIIGSFAGGAATDGGEGSPALSASLNSPTLLTFDSQGNLFIATYSNIRKVAPDGTITTFAGGGTETPADGKLARVVSFQYPRGLAVDANGNLYFSDFDRNRIWKVTPDGVLHLFAGNGQSFGTIQDGAPATGAPVVYPGAIFIDQSGTVWFVDSVGVHNVGSDGLIHTLTRLGAGPYPSAEAQGLAVDAQSNLFMTFGSRLLYVDPHGFIRTIAGNYSPGTSGDGGPPELALLRNPTALTLDSSGNLFFIDADRVREITNVASCAAPAVPEIGLTSFPGQPVDFNAGTMAPGKRVTLMGINLGPLESVRAQPDADGFFPAALGTARVFVNGIAAPVLAAQNTEITFVVPYSAVTGTLQIEFQGVRSAAARVTIVPVSATILLRAPGSTAVSPSRGTAYALNEDGTVNSVSNPAPVGSIVAIFVTGEGQTDPPGVDGKAALDPLPKPLVAPLVFTFGVAAPLKPVEVTFYGAFPGEIGKMQINFRVPLEVVPSKSDLYSPGPGSALILVYSDGAYIFVK